MKKCYINEIDNTIVFDKNFFNALYIEKSKTLEKELSSLSLRLASFLLQELDEIEYKKLPKRKYLAEKLNVSRNSIISSLYQLEVSGFLQRCIKENQLDQAIIYADENKQLEKEKYFETKILERLEKRDFSDLFKINSNYNDCDRKMTMEEFTEIILGFNNKCENISVDRILEIEKRLDVIENKLKIK